MCMTSMVLLKRAVLECYFERHRIKSLDALQELERVRRGMWDWWMRAPAQERARRLVREWRG